MHNLPQEFRHIRLELAREPDQPVGDTKHGYDILMPLTGDGHIDGDLARAHKVKCRVRRFRPGEEDAIGVLVHGPGGRWFIDYNADNNDDNEPGFRFEEERFTIGEYVSIREDDGVMHTFQVMRVAEV